MRPSQTLVPRVASILRAQPQLPPYIALSRRQWWNLTKKVDVETSPAPPSIPTSSPSFLNTRHSTFFPSPHTNAVPQPTLAWNDFLSMV